MTNQRESCVNPQPLMSISLDSYDSDESELFDVRKVDIKNPKRIKYP